MPTRTELTQLALDAKHDGATHVFVARSRRNHAHHYAVPVYPGQDPRDVIRTSRDPLTYCLALQHQNLPLRDQLTEHRPWHPEPAPGVSVEDLARLAPPDPADRHNGVPAAIVPTMLARLRHGGPLPPGATRFAPFFTRYRTTPEVREDAKDDVKEGAQSCPIPPALEGDRYRTEWSPRWPPELWRR
jgi:hypothetical protein